MMGQKNINSFFPPVSKKRLSKEAEEDAEHSKKLMASTGQPAPPPPGQRDEEAALEPPPPGQWDEEAALEPPPPGQRDEEAALEPPPPGQRDEEAALEPPPPGQRDEEAALEPPGFGESWRDALAAEFGKPYFKRLMTFVSEERSRGLVFPPAEDVFTWTQCAVRQVKVVILGQDPYHGPLQAHGLCFSVRRPERPPPSLENVFKELASDIEGFQHPGHGDLTAWAAQGVLLLNAVLTVRVRQANSHKDRGWETFTDAVVRWLSANLHGLVFLLWGAYAQKKGAAIDRKRHHVLQAVHPSPLSCHRGFFGCKHFSKANELLETSGKSPVNWKEL